MKTRKKNRFFTFCLSCIPGAGEMYMGFMKTGVSMMLIFGLTIVFAMWLNQGAIAAFGIVEWFYSFFYSNHLAALSDEEFEQVEDKYLLGLDNVLEMKNSIQKYHKWVAYLLIFVGVSFLWNTTAEILYYVLPNPFEKLARIMWKIGDYVPSILIGLGIIFLGVKMIGGKKEIPAERMGIPEKEAADTSSDSGKQEE